MRNLALLRETLDSRFGGVLRYGSHEPDGKVCALELVSQVRGDCGWTDDPKLTRTWDLRSLNDVPVSDTVRTTYLLPVLAEYMGCMDWPEERQQQVTERLVLLTVQRLVAELPGLSESVRQRCRDYRTLEEARAAADTEAADAEAAEAAAWAAEAAAAGRMAAARETVFIRACQVWLDAVRDV